MPHFISNAIFNSSNVVQIALGLDQLHMRVPGIQRVEAFLQLPVDTVRELRSPEPGTQRQLLQLGRSALRPAFDEAWWVAALVRWAFLLRETCPPACRFGEIHHTLGNVDAGGGHAGHDHSDVELDDGPYANGLVGL